VPAVGDLEHPATMTVTTTDKAILRRATTLLHANAWFGSGRRKSRNQGVLTDTHYLRQ
jgi:hypothetical protein